jgi:ATP-dependent Clp protease protease subunit
VFDRLLERRIVLVSGSLDAERMTSVAARLMLLDATGDGPVELRMMCPDGDLDAALALADTVDLLGVEVRACAAGRLGGPALAPFAAAGRRSCHPHATFLLRDADVSVEGRATELVAQVCHRQGQLRSLHERLASACHQPVERVVSDMRNGSVLDAAEALAYGLVQDVVG